jgi:hypothetical protein
VQENLHDSHSFYLWNQAIHFILFSLLLPQEEEATDYDRLKRHPLVARVCSKLTIQNEETPSCRVLRLAIRSVHSLLSIAPF